MKRRHPYRIIAADDHAIFLQGLCSLLQDKPDYTLVTTCSDGDQTIEATVQHQPDFLLLDLSMRGASAGTIIETVEKQSMHTCVIALTMNCNAATALQLLQLGLCGYVLKDEAFENLEVAMQSALLDECFISASIREKIADCRRNGTNGNELTEKEKAVLSRAAQGMTNQEIADAIFVSERTVRFHIANCCLKLQANGRTNAVAKALKSQLIRF